MNIHKLRDQYRILVQEFVNQARAAGATVHSSEVSVTPINDGTSQVSVAGTYYLKEWPCNSGSTKQTKKLDILLKSKEIYEVDSLVLRQSVVQVMYFNSAEKEANPTLGLHYDYEYGAGQAHPIFHAQFGSTDFTSAELKQVKFRKAPIQPWKDMVRVRIPTVHMGFPAAVLSLFADHLPHSSFQCFLKWANKHVLFSDAKARVDCRSAPLSSGDSSMFQAHRMYV
ncbi:hypothetical protein [Pseudomonas gingeri]|uniref:Uncharacterized protein n=1 Tax=Pseudomonas gingeri TaxID=117681 RepID=A0A7Y8BUF9_9PSED|nr:hypothetical protein [Pseudomonas gingeri]NWB88413.1 hypothetical protein [Pseudomonas gingeri]